MGLNFKIPRGNGWPDRGRQSASGLAPRPARRPRRVLGQAAGSNSRCRPQPRQPQQVISPRYEVAPGLRPFASPIPAPPEATHRLDPAKYLLHRLRIFKLTW